MTGPDSDGQAGGDAGPPPPKIVGPNITGKREEYRLERRLQSGLFGGVYEAKGLSSGRMFAVKVLHRSELHKAARASSLEFCEVPLSEIKYADLMRGHEHVMQVEDHFEDQYCHYIVFELARGGDLLEALKLKPNGFDEQHAQFLIGQAARGLACLHDRRLAMQDVSLENMLLHVLDNGEYQVKIIDPGQAALFDVDSQSGKELPVKFHGFVGKSFRPPEIHSKQPYLSTQVDAWCLGWSTFYLLAAQPLFLSADPAQQDPDWELFERSEFATLFRQKATSCSQECIDFILRLLVLDPKRRMTVHEALEHDWLKGSNSKAMFAPQDQMPPPLTPDKILPPRQAATPETRAENGYAPVRPPMALTPELRAPIVANPPEAGPVTPTTGGRLNGNHIPKDEPRGPTRLEGLSAGMPAGFRGAGGGLTGSLGGPGGGGLAGGPGGGLSAGGHFSSGGGPGGLGTAGGPGSLGDWQPRRGAQGAERMAPAWKMAPPSRTESPGPAAWATGQPGRLGYYQGGASAGTPTPNQYVSVQARSPSPFASGPRNAGFSPLQRRSPSPPPRQAAMQRPGANVYGGPREGNSSPWNEFVSSQNAQISGGGSQTSHTPRPARASGASGGARSLMIAQVPGGSAADGAEYGATPQQQLSAALTEGGMGDGQASVDMPNLLDIMGGSGRHASAAGLGRTSSPMPQASLLMRSQNGRGLSPSPMRNLAGLDASWMQQPRSGSPMQQHGGPPGAMRGMNGSNAGSIDAAPGGGGPGQFWSSPRTASPSGGLFRQPEAFSRGRAAQRTLSPSGSGLSPFGAANPAVGGLMRTLSPSGVLPGRAGIAWSPVPSSPPAPTRAISPQPSSIVVSGHNNGANSLRWDPGRARS